MAFWYNRHSEELVSYDHCCYCAGCVGSSDDARIVAAFPPSNAKYRPRKTLTQCNFFGGTRVAAASFKISLTFSMAITHTIFV